MALLDEIQTAFHRPPTQAVTKAAETPAPRDVPAEWSSAYLGPGMPITPFTSTTYRAQVEENEPRTFSYVPSVNATLSPRAPYGLLSFAQLKYYGENVPEVSMCIRLLTEELKTLMPRLVDPDDGLPLDDDTVEDLGLEWMTTAPDGVTPWETWLSRFLYNVLVYDAGALYKMREGKAGAGLKVVDGSTLFALIDQHGEQPKAPAPAFTQVIQGTPFIFLSSDNLWYRPRHLRADAPYGRTAVEDSLRSVRYLDNLWSYSIAGYEEGNMPEMLLLAPPDWPPDKCLIWEQEFNARMSGNAAERRRLRVIPSGFSELTMKSQGWDTEGYKNATERVGLAFGIPPSEIGKVPGQGLGGKGYQDEGKQAFYRMGIGPLKAYIESPFNELIRELGLDDDAKFELASDTTEIDQQRNAETADKAWNSGASMRDEYRQAIGLETINGPAGEVFLMPTGVTELPLADSGKPKPEPVAPAEPGPAAAEQKPDAPEQDPPKEEPGGEDVAVKLAKAFPRFDLTKHCGVCPDDDAYYGQPVSRVTTVPFLHQGANETEIVAISPRALESRPALWKPQAGEKTSLAEAIGGPMYPREEAAYLVDRCLEFYLVPVAYVVELDGELGAVMHYVRGSEPLDDPAAYDPAWVERAAVLDYANGQLDRGGHNWLTHPDDPRRPVLIDNGLTFPTTDRYPLRSAFVRAWAGKRLSDGVTNALLVLQGQYNLWLDLEALVGADACALAKGRIEQMLSTGVVPEAGS